MEQTDTDDRRPVDEVDPATQAFARLEGEMAKRLGAVAQGLNAIAEKPAMQLTPEGLAARIEAASQGTRRADQTALVEARERFERGSQTMREIAGTAHTSREQRRHLVWVAGGGLLAGLALWSFLPGAIARAMPDSWLLPERIATRMLGARSSWEGGMRLMQAGSPRAWTALTQAADMQRDNREAIGKCRKAAALAGKPARCTIEIGPAP